MAALSVDGRAAFLFMDDKNDTILVEIGSRFPVRVEARPVMTFCEVSDSFCFALTVFMYYPNGMSYISFSCN